MTSSQDTAHTRDDLPDGRNGDVVGEKDDSVLESIGKAIVAPVEGADEEASPADPAKDRPFTDLTPTLPQGDSAMDKPRASGTGRDTL